MSFSWTKLDKYIVFEFRSILATSKTNIHYSRDEFSINFGRNCCSFQSSHASNKDWPRTVEVEQGWHKDCFDVTQLF